MIAETKELIKRWGNEYRSDILLGITVALISLISFQMGRISVIWSPKTPVKVILPAESKPEAGTPSVTKGDKPSAPAVTEEIGVVASKNGSAYHLPECSGALKIKAENKIVFRTREEAERAGYHAAGNCPGL